jgi:biopolymer transport protein ExbB/TolQ/biopolymer transport protein ExbD
MHLFAELLQGFSITQDGFLFMWGLAAIAIAAAVLVVERVIELNGKTKVDAPLFTERVLSLIRNKKINEAYELCVLGGGMALPRIFGRTIKQARTAPHLARYAMEEEFIRSAASLDKRVNLIFSFGHISTLLGLMGTIYGLILAFSAAGMQGVAAIEKSVLLAAGISTAMNTTLLGLIISIPCIIAYSMLRTRIDEDINELDRYTLPLLRSLVDDDKDLQDYKLSRIRTNEDKESSPNLGPLMSLIIILIPLLLTSAEFVKVGEIELNLPAPSEEVVLSDSPAEMELDKLRLGLVVDITEKGFNISHQLQEEGEESYIPLINGSYDFLALKMRLAEIKREVLLEIIKGVYADLPPESTLAQLFTIYSKKRDYFSISGSFYDSNSIQISADDSVQYQHFISVMDVARDIRTNHGRVSMFPDVVVAGGGE